MMVKGQLCWIRPLESTALPSPFHCGALWIHAATCTTHKMLVEHVLSSLAEAPHKWTCSLCRYKELILLEVCLF